LWVSRFRRHLYDALRSTLILRQVHGRDDAARIARPVVEKLIADHIAE
jgi:hypothetical protein